MEKNYLFIHDIDDFGLAINAATRMYRRRPDDDTLAALCITFKELMPYLDNRTLICAIRDFQPGSVETWCRDDEDGPAEFIRLRESIMIEYVNRRLKEKDYKTEYLLTSIGHDMEAIADGYHKGCFDTSEKFLAWAEKNCNAENTIGWNGITDRIPIPESYLPHFNRICLLAAEYAWRRQTYMPDSIAAVIKANLDLITEETAKEIRKAVAGDIENTCWVFMDKKLREKFEDSIV